MSIIDQITNHIEQAKSRLITQYKDSENINSIVSVYASEVQEIEDQAFLLINERTLDGSVGFQLDQMGTILNEPREGLTDDDYRIRLKAKIAENVSEGTPEDLISIFRMLLNPDEVFYNEVYPAGFELTAIGNQTPISSVQRVKDALIRAKPSGVDLIEIKQATRFPEFVFFDDTDPTGGGFRDLLVLSGELGAFDFRDINDLLVPTVSFSFLGDTDPNGKGFGDLNDPSDGGEFASIVDTETNDPSFGDANDSNVGKDFAAILETDDTDNLNPTAGFLSDII